LDAVKKAWYVGPEVDPAKIAKWEVRYQPEPTLDPRAEFAEALRSIGGIVDGDHPIMNGEAQRIPAHDDRRGDRTIFYLAHVAVCRTATRKTVGPKRSCVGRRGDSSLSQEAKAELLGASPSGAIRAAPSRATDVRGDLKAPK
jgi:hypothetical protein